MVQHIIFLIIGIALIIAGCNYVTNGSVAIANKFHLSPLLIGLTVVAFGSSTPDFVVSLFSTLHGKTGLATGNIVGAVIFDMILVIGIMALIKPLNVSKSALNTDLPVMVLGALLLFVCAQTHLFDPNAGDIISRADGLIMLIFFSLYMFHIITNAKKDKLSQANIVQSAQTNTQPASTPSDTAKPKKPMNMVLAIVCILGGLGALVIGGQWIVNSASAIAKHYGMSEALIGLTIVGIGSSLPDLATSLVASIKGQTALALGNVVGACIIDILFVLGTCAIIHPLDVETISFVDFGTLAVASIIVLLFAIFGRKKGINRAEGAFLVLSYIAYIVYLVTK